MVIELHQLTKDYGEAKGIFHVSTVFHEGITGILGENGAGKSTMFKLIMGLLKPTHGEIIINGLNLWQDDALLKTKKWIGYLPPESYLIPDLTGEENLSLVSYLRLRETTAWKTLLPYVELLDLQTALSDPLKTYSSGMQKKLHLIASLIGAPQILIWDEPYNGLDILAILQMKKILTNYASERNATVLFASHIVEMVEELCSRVCILHKGKLHYHDTLPKKGELTSFYTDILLQNTKASM